MPREGNVFPWGKIWTKLSKDRGPEKLPLRSTFISVAGSLLKTLHQEKMIPVRDLIRDCKERMEATEYRLTDIPSTEEEADKVGEKFGDMSAQSISRCLFFRLLLLWLEVILEKTCETAIMGVDDYDVIPTAQDVANLEPDWQVVSNFEDWVWVSVAKTKN
ncbi:hypothetical protein QBC40DRAFT_268544 [Triangularia verruculosa]|uniref:Uncharacterized protein n=1 Tax=Triangularia verruculosa TaxID=2587418 RepID=A0AAN7ARZ6_9PEZI|nr:hypothetical protein QBC40DRAFT_268544 [Triangularia verruculosa]